MITEAREQVFSFKRVKRGEIYFAKIPSDNLLGSEQVGIRPVLVLQNDVGNRYSPTTIVALITSKKKNDLPTHVLLPKSLSGLPQDSIIMLEQIRTIDKRRLFKRVRALPASFMEEVNQRILISLGVDPRYQERPIHPTPSGVG